MMKASDVQNEFLRRTGLGKSGEKSKWTPLQGGVSSDIWRVDLLAKTICVKRALPQLRVKAEWLAPVERNNYEWEWFRFVDSNFDGIVPKPLAHDAELGMLAMQFLPPEAFTNWKTELLSGEIDIEFAGKVGTALGKIHAKSAGDEILQALFDTDKLFFALRIEPYLLATGEKHPQLSERIRAMADETLATKIALVHGDVSPKNILKGGRGPVFLDAETAWYGDPAFDAAFCLNHFLLKSVLKSDRHDVLADCFAAFGRSYLSEVKWEKTEKLKMRIARILPILSLARIDGKSPVEYLTLEETKTKVRRFCYEVIESSPDLFRIPALLAAQQ